MSTDEIRRDANTVAAAMFIASAESEGEFVTGDDGYVVYWPKHCGGAFSAWTLRAFADELDRRNAAWDAHMQEYFSSVAREPGEGK